MQKPIIAHPQYSTAGRTGSNDTNWIDRWMDGCRSPRQIECPLINTEEEERQCAWAGVGFACFCTRHEHLIRCFQLNRHSEITHREREREMEMQRS